MAKKKKKKKERNKLLVGGFFIKDYIPFPWENRWSVSNLDEDLLCLFILWPQKCILECNNDVLNFIIEV